MRSFRLTGLAPELFAPLFDLSDAQLAQRGIARCIAPPDATWPCRVSLVQATPGEELLLLPFVHQPATSPYQASGPIYVRRGAPRAVLAPGEVPDIVRSRLISIRAYDTRHWIVDGMVREGALVGAELARLMQREDVAYVHLHNAGRGCFACLAMRCDDALSA